MKAIVLTFALLVMSVCIIAQTTYYVNIDNAPNNSAVGKMEAWSDGVSWGSADLVWYANYNNGRGGMYKASSPLPTGYIIQPVTIKCKARKKYEVNGPWGYSEQTFTGGSSSFLPTLHIPNTQIQPVNPPYPY